MSRYLERAAHTAQTLDVTLNQMLDHAHGGDAQRWNRALACWRVPMSRLQPVEKDNADASGHAADNDGHAANGQATKTPQTMDTREIMRGLTFETGNSFSILSCIASARENARQVREQVSSEMWEQLNRLYLSVRGTDMDEVWNSEPHAFFQEIEEGARLFQGITDSSMSHGEGWHFIGVGRAIERANNIATILDAHFGGPHALATREGGLNSLSAAGDANALSDYTDWIGLLRSCQAFEAYCKVYTADVQPRRIAEFLLLNPRFPNSVRFNIEALAEALQGIARESDSRNDAPVERIVGRLRAELQFASIEEIMGDGFHGYLDNVQKRCGDIHNALQQIYIAYPVNSAIAN